MGRLRAEGIESGPYDLTVQYFSTGFGIYERGSIREYTYLAGKMKIIILFTG